MESEKRYQVFVSSTYLDLREARAAVVSALLNLDAFPAGMELFPATDDDAWSLIEDVISDSDYYLLIIGGKYGSVDAELAVSFTEREYDTAVRLQKPVMAFLHGQPGKLLAEQTEDSDERRERLAAFRAKVEKAKHVKYWTSPEDLAGKVALSWNSFRRRYPTTGWIKADQLADRESLAALARAQAEIDDLTARLQQARTQAPSGTDQLAQGDSRFALPVYVNTQFWADGGHVRSAGGKWTSVDLTWDRVFGFLGLRMMQESDEPTLQDDLCSVAQMDHFDQLQGVARAVAEVAAESQKVEEWGFRIKELEVSDEDFQTVLLQLDALGLIQHSTKKNRSVKDTANYWTLTPYGHTRLVQLRALQRGTESLEREEEAMVGNVD